MGRKIFLPAALFLAVSGCSLLGDGSGIVWENVATRAAKYTKHVPRVVAAYVATKKLIPRLEEDLNYVKNDTNLDGNYVRVLEERLKDVSQRAIGIEKFIRDKGFEIYYQNDGSVLVKVPEQYRDQLGEEILIES